MKPRRDSFGEEVDEESWQLHSATHGYRLPTEAEWEYACRAGSKTAYTFGDDVSLLGKYGVFWSETSEEVGSRLPNAWGLFDMHGNVCEWCQDWFGLWGEHSVDDPEGPTEGSSRVLRGGVFASPAGKCRSASQLGFPPSTRFLPGMGFRVARSSVE